MRPGISIILSPADRRRLEALVGDRNVAQKHVWRARIVLHSADGIGTNGIMRRTGKSKTCVWRWQERFAQEGYDGLLRDKTRPSRIPPLGPEVAERVVALTLSDPPAEATHWVAAMMAKATGISVSSVQRIWRAHGLRPHRVRQFKLSNDPDFVAKLRDVVGLHVDPPAHAIVLSVDEKSQIQALDRTQPGLPMKKGRLGTMTHDDKRHGTTTLFAALNVLEGKVIGRCMQRHRHQEFIRFLNAIEADIPAGKGVHVILDNYAAHKHAKVRAWLGRHEQLFRIGRYPDWIAMRRHNHRRPAHRLLGVDSLQITILIGRLPGDQKPATAKTSDCGIKLVVDCVCVGPKFRSNGIAVGIEGLSVDPPFAAVLEF